MPLDLILKPSCSGCGEKDQLYGSSCKHLTLCLNCGKSMADKGAKCYECGTPITQLIKEYNVRASSSNDKNYFIGRFTSGLPNFKKKENKWSLQKEGLNGRHVTDTMREKYKNKPWMLEDETGQFQYQGHLEGSQSATYYLLMLHGKEFFAIPACSWYNFNKVAQYKQLTLEEAEEKMKVRRKTADGYERWMMKAANSGAATFGAEADKFDDREGASGAGRGRKKTTGEDDEANDSDRAGEDEEEEAARKNRLGLNKKAGDDDEEGPRGGDLDFDDDDIEKGDDWEHEEIFTDDDEAVGNDPEEREDLAPEIPAPPEIKQDEEDEEEGGLSKSGKELQKLLGRSNELNDSDGEDEDDEDNDTEDDVSPVLAPKKEVLKEEPVDNISPLKSTTSAAGRGIPSTSKSSKAKRKSSGEDSKPPNSTPMKKLKTENDVKPVKREFPASSKTSVPAKGTTPPSNSRPAPATEDEIRAVLLQKGPVTTQELVAKFRSRLKCKEDKDAFAAVLRRMSKIQKTNGANYIVLRQT